MIGRGHEVTLACVHGARIFAEAPRFGVPVTALPIGRKRPQGVIALRRFLAKHPVDVINAHSSTDAWLAALACRALTAPPPLVRTRHISAPVPRDRLTRWLYTRATAQVVTTGEAIRVGADPRNRRRAIARDFDSHRRRPGALCAARQARGASLAAPAGGRAADRDLRDAAQLEGSSLPGRGGAVARAPRRASCSSSGRARSARRCNSRSPRSGLAIGCAWSGNRDDVAPWLAALDVFALPSYADEGVPQALVQAMFVGVPCVTTNAGAIGEVAIADHTALVVAKQNAVALAGAIDRLLGDPALGSRLVSAARERVAAKFSLASMLEHMEVVFRRARRRATAQAVACTRSRNGRALPDAPGSSWGHCDGASRPPAGDVRHAIRGGSWSPITCCSATRSCLRRCWRNCASAIRARTS